MAASMVYVAMTGCSVPLDGWLGVGRASDGTLRVYLRTCTQPVDGASLWWPDDPRGNSDQEVFADWTIAARHQGPLQLDWPLLGPSAGEVATTQSLQVLPGPPKNMGLMAGTRDASTSASGPYLFTSSDLDHIKPGQILIEDPTGDEKHPNKTVSQSAFTTLDCAVFR